jgi:hypothetical protein
MKLIKLFWLILFISEAHAVSLSEAKKNAVIGALVVSLEIPVVLAYENAARSDFLTEIQDFRYWISGLTVGALVGGLVYYFSKQYTPQSIYEWALRKKEEVEFDSWLWVVKSSSRLSSRRMKEKLSTMFDRLPLMSAVNYLYQQHNILQRAHKNIYDLIQELDDGDALKQKCSVLLTELQEMIETVKEHAVIIACDPEWYNEFSPIEQSGIPISILNIPRDKINCTKWVVELTGGEFTVDIFNKPKHVVFGKKIGNLLALQRSCMQK